MADGGEAAAEQQTCASGRVVVEPPKDILEVGGRSSFRRDGSSRTSEPGVTVGRSDGQGGERVKVEAVEQWDLTIRSIDSAFSSSQFSITTTNSAILSPNSSNNDSQSETVVDAKEAGILGGNVIRDEGAAALLSDPSLTSKVESRHLCKGRGATTLLTVIDDEVSEGHGSYSNDRRATLQLNQSDPGLAPQKVLLETSHVDGAPARPLSSSTTTYGRAIDEDHVNFVLMYDMLTGIRHSVSACQAKTSRPLTDQDFQYARTYNFMQQASDITPSKYEFRFKDYSPWVFRSLRSAFKIDAADYLVSLTGKYALSEMGSPGKSGSLFYFSQDFRYIIKTIRQSEHEFLRRILRRYYDHIRKNSNSLITRFYGLHRVRLSNVRKIYFVVMGNIFVPTREIHETYDLKGCTLGRIVSQREEREKNGNVTLKDLNWIKKKRSLKLGPEKATLLMNQLKADCTFLAKMRIMDYSLLVGIHYSSLRHATAGRGSCDRSKMKMCEPTTPTINNQAVPPTFKQSSITTGPSVAGSSSDIPSERKTCIFYSDDGGFKSSHKNGDPGDEVYFLGVIDILTPYSVSKRIEHVFKSIQHGSVCFLPLCQLYCTHEVFFEGIVGSLPRTFAQPLTRMLATLQKSISAVNPIDYSQRFLSFVSQNILQDTEADYATKDLPVLPFELVSSEAIYECQRSIALLPAVVPTGADDVNESGSSLEGSDQLAT